MFNRDSPSRVRRGKFGGIALLALLAPLTATSGLSATGSIEATGVQSAVATVDKESYPAGTYQLRCWQYGRLLFEENYITLPVEASRKGAKIAGSDRSGKPVLVTDTSNATCLIRTPNEERGSSRQIP